MGERAPRSTAQRTSIARPARRLTRLMRAALGAAQRLRPLALPSPADRRPASIPLQFSALSPTLLPVLGVRQARTLAHERTSKRVRGAGSAPRTTLLL